MKIKFLATGQSPDYYSINGEVITAHLGEVSEQYDLSEFPEGAQFEGADPVNGVPAIRGVVRDAEGLHVTLCQQVGAGHWEEGGWMDEEDYDPDGVHVVYTSQPHSGTPWAKTRQGKQFMSRQDEEAA